MNPQDPYRPYTPPAPEYRVVLPPPPLPNRLQQVPPEPVPRPRPRPIWVVLGALAVVVVGLCSWLITTQRVPETPAAAAATSAQEADTWAVTIDFTFGNSSCEGDGGYSDIGSGTPVTLKDETGRLVGSDTLYPNTPSSGQCTWTIRMDDVPSDLEFYVAEVGSRGEISYSRDQLVSENFTIGLYLGD